MNPAASGLAVRLAPVVAELGDFEPPLPVDLAAFKLNENIVELKEGPHAALQGPLPPRGPATGLVAVGGTTLVSWGTPARADVAFSMTKAALGTLAGVALGDGLIGDLDAPVRDLLPVTEFEGPHNGRVTWRHLLDLTSEWSGTLWGIPDSIDWHRAVPKRPDAPPKGSHRDLQAPGTYWEFNDVRVNLLALALTRLFGNDLGEVFATRVLRPIGGGDGFVWNGFDGADIDIGGRKVHVVSGGGHWGGGLVISTDDLARFAALQLWRGVWEGQRLIPDRWFDLLREASPHNLSFGLMWWVNRSGQLPFLSKETIWASGIGNFLVIDPARDLTVILRWYDVPRRDDILRRITGVVDEDVT